MAERNPSGFGELAAESFCYLTTTGRATGRLHTIEIWFGLYGKTAYMLSGGRERSDWVRNIMASDEVALRVGNQVFEAHARIVTDPDEDGMARNLLVTKYQPSHGADLSGWRERALPVAVDLRVDDDT